MKTKKLLPTALTMAARWRSALGRNIAIVGVLTASLGAAKAINYTTDTAGTLSTNNRPVFEATGNSLTMTTFSNDVATAFADNTGGVWSFEGTTFGLNVGDTITLNYGTTLAHSLVLTLSSGNNINQAFNSGEATSGTYVLGLGGDTTPRVFTPNKPLLAVGIFNTDRAADGRNPVLTVTYLDASTASTSGAHANDVFFHGLTGTGANPIVSFSISQDNYVRYDDLAFIVSSTALAPQITTQPASQSIYESDVLGLSAAVVGTDLVYQWRAGAPYSGIYTNIPGATSATLTIPWVTTSADYILYVTNTSGSVLSDVAYVTVNPPTYENGLFNGGFELPGVITATGFDTAGKDISGWRNAGPNQNDSGLDASFKTGSFSAKVQKGQSGAYQITTNVLQLGDSIIMAWWERNAWQGLTAKVSLLSASAPQDAFASTTELVAQTNVLGNGNTDFNWYQRSLTYTAGAADVGKRLGVFFGTTDPGSGGWGDFDDFSIAITPAAAAPTIVTQPASQTAWLASATTFTVLANGTGLNYQWQAGEVASGLYTNIANGGQFSGATTATLTLSNVAVANGLDYVVIVSNTGGATTSAPPATLTVNLDAPYMGAIASKTVFSRETTTLAPAWVNGVTSYQWMAGAVGGGTYTNLVNGGRFSGVTTMTLTITNVQVADGLDYVLVASNVSGSSTNGPATLTVIPLIYAENFNSTDTNLSAVGWVADYNPGQTPLQYQALWSAGPTGVPQAFYTTPFFATGSIPDKMAFPVIKLADVSNMTFYMDEQSYWLPELIHSRIAVQVNGRAWYVSTTEYPTATGTMTTQTMPFDPSAAAWNELTVTGTGGTNDATLTIIGAAATNDLTGYITGAGLVTVHDGSSWILMDNFKITGDGFTVLPGLSLTPSGANVSVSWGYGTLLEAPSVTGPWTLSGGTSPKLVPPTGSSRFYSLQLP